MKAIKSLLAALDSWQRRHQAPAMTYAVIKKYSDDNANLLVVSLGWYGFTAIYPLLLVVVTIFGFIGEASLGGTLVHTLHQFPVIGAQFNQGPGGHNLHGSAFGLVVGILGLLYGAQGVTQSAQQAMARVWNVPQVDRPGFLSRLGRSMASLVIIGLAFVVSAAVGGIVTGAGRSYAIRVPVLAVLLLINVGFYVAAFRTLTPKEANAEALLPGAIVGGVGFTLLTTIGTGLIAHQLKHTNATYGAFASVIGVVTYLLLLAKLSVYAAEFNPVRARRLWPRALPTTEPTDADNQVLRDLAHEEVRRKDQRVGVGFGADSTEEVEKDAETPVR